MTHSLLDEEGIAEKSIVIHEQEKNLEMIKLSDMTHGLSDKEGIAEKFIATWVREESWNDQTLWYDSPAFE